MPRTPGAKFGKVRRGVGAIVFVSPLAILFDIRQTDTLKSKKRSTPSHSVEFLRQALTVAFGNLDLVLWLVQRTIRPPSKGGTFAYFWLQK